MAEPAQPAAECPIHQAWRRLHKSSVMRIALTLNLFALRLLRDRVDRRLARLQRIEPHPIHTRNQG